MNPVCDVCGLRHITVERPRGLGFVCGYREVDEHFHESYEEMLACQNRASPHQYDRAVRAIAKRSGTRGKHPRQPAHGSGDKPTPPVEAIP